MSDTSTPSRGGTGPHELIDDVHDHLASAIDGAPRWAAGLVAGVQAVMLSLAVVVAPVLAAFVATSADPSNADVDWLRAVGLGTDFWLLGHGVPLSTGAGAVTLVPLGLAAFAVFACFASARRSGRASRSGYLTAVGGYVGATLLVAVCRLVDADSSVSPLRTLGSAVLGALLLGGAGLGAGLLARDEAPRLRVVLEPVARRFSLALRTGFVGGLAVISLVVALAGLLVVAWVLEGQSAIADIVSSLGLDALGGGTLAIGELVLVPNLVLWAVAWLAGPGFAVGAGSQFSISGVMGAPLPAVPLLGALPQPDSVTPLLAWWPLAVVAVGALVGAALHRRLAGARWVTALTVAATAAGTAAVGVLVLVQVAGGAAGPGRMAHVGASGIVTGFAVGAEAFIGLAVVLLGASPDAHHTSRRVLARATSRR